MNTRTNPAENGLRTAARSLLTILLLLAAFAVVGCENGCGGDADDETAMHDEGMMTEDEGMHDEGMHDEGRMADDEAGAMHEEGAMGDDAMHDEAPMDSTAHRGGGMGGGR